MPRPAIPTAGIGANDISPPPGELEAATSAIAAAKRPIIIVGYGARDGMGEIVSLAEKLKAPVLTTFKAKGQISDHHPNAAGVLGRSGTPIASWFMNESDLIIAFGASFSNHTGDRSRDTRLFRLISIAWRSANSTRSPTRSGVRSRRRPA